MRQGSTAPTRALSIRRRLILGFAAVSAVLAVSVGVGVLSARRATSDAHLIADVRAPTALASSALAADINATLAAMRGYLLVGADKFKTDRAAAWTRIDGRRAELDRLAGAWTSQENKDAWGEARPLLEQLRRVQDEIEPMADRAAAAERLAKEAAPKAARLLELFGAQGQGGIVGRQAVLLSGDVDRLSGGLGTSVLVGITCLLGGLALAGGAAWLTARSVVDPLLGMTDAMGRLAGGERGIAIPGLGRGDEIGRMAQAMEVFQENAIRADRLAAEEAEAMRARQRRAELMEALCAAFDREVSTALQTMAGATHQTEQAAQSMAATADQASRQSVAVSAAADQASANVQTVASAAEELASSITEISRQVTRSAAVLGDAVTAAERTDGTVQSLATRAQSIGEVIRLISDIAAQTNLLALNATIEAARAGEAGKGFAVVASEVKALATQTARATEEISVQVSAIQGATVEAVEALKSIGTAVVQANQIAAAIASAVEEQGAATAEIARNVSQASAGTAEVSQNIAGVTEAASHTGAAAVQVKAAAESMAKQSLGLKGQVEAFLRDVKAA
ncbi:MAG TPA: methyl-accepting chemotaxis protein [Azospirillaceae bacterium]|nr:methyl-accepting chemotaxis protein [Azospirillaceae bacterium]